MSLRPLTTLTSRSPHISQSLSADPFVWKKPEARTCTAPHPLPREEQLSWRTSSEQRCLSGHLVTQQGVEDGEQLMHTGGQGDPLGLASGEQALAECVAHRTVAHTEQGGHVERRADPPSTAAAGPRVAPGPATALER